MTEVWVLLYEFNGRTGMHVFATQEAADKELALGQEYGDYVGAKIFKRELRK